MSPEPFVHHSDQNCTCTDCAAASEPGVLARVIGLLLAALVVLVLAAASDAKAPRPIKAPPALLHARAACPNDATPVECRAALVHAYDALRWQRNERLHARLLPASNLTPIEVGRALARRRAWSGRQFVCLVTLWSRESGWRVFASNGTSGATGIPQALPGWKMARMGRDWRTNAATQIRWGLFYIKRAYGTPCAALAHSDRWNWY